jgi:hypothetical protein
MYKPYDVEKVVDTRNRLNNIYSERRQGISHYTNRSNNIESDHLIQAPEIRTLSNNNNIHIQDESKIYKDDNPYLEPPHQNKKALIKDSRDNKPYRPQSQRETRKLHSTSPVTNLEYDEKKVREIINKYSDTNRLTDKEHTTQDKYKRDEFKAPDTHFLRSSEKNNPQYLGYEERKTSNLHDDYRQNYNRSTQYENNKVVTQRLDNPTSNNRTSNYSKPHYLQQNNQTFRRKEDLDSLKNYSNNLAHDDQCRYRHDPQYDNRVPDSRQSDEQFKLDSKSKNFVLEKLNRLGSTIDRRTPI